MDRAKQSYIYAGLAVFFWSTVPTVFKIGLGELDILTMLTIATFTSTITLFIILLSGKKSELFRKITRKELLSSASLGLINPFIYYIILLKAYRLLPGQVAQPLNMIWPIILVFLSVPILKQKIPAKSFIALFISFTGVYIISSQGHPFKPGSSDPLGVLLATGSSVLWALYFIFNVKDKRDESVKLFTNFLCASIFLAIATIITGNWHPGVSLKGFAASVYIGVFEMGITFFFWLKALQLAETSDKVSNLVYLAPFVSLVFLYFIIKEPVYYTTPVGLLLIISGIYVQNRKTKKTINGYLCK
jgi:drug/metabolite transporter (DMT)-like permease